MKSHHHVPLASIALVVGSALCFSTLDSIVQSLAPRYPIPLLLFARWAVQTLALVAWLVFVVPCMRGLQAQETGSTGRPPGSIAHFDLPAQPLARALQDFARLTELIVLAPAPLLDGRTSAPVQGDYVPRDALGRMLAGTGLRAEFSGPDEAIIVAQPEAETAPAPADTPADAALPIDGIGDSGERRAFAGLLQAHLIEALCAQPAAVPGSYRLVAQVRIDNRGAVVAVNMVASSGSAARDAGPARGTGSPSRTGSGRGAPGSPRRGAPARSGT